jgi:hypothetical protein
MTQLLEKAWRGVSRAFTDIAGDGDERSGNAADDAMFGALTTTGFAGSHLGDTQHPEDTELAA